MLKEKHVLYKKWSKSTFYWINNNNNNNGINVKYPTGWPWYVLHAKYPSTILGGRFGNVGEVK